MTNTKRYAIPVLMVSLPILCIGGTMAAVSCNPDMPQKPLPAYFFNVQFPEGENYISTLTIEQGSSVNLPVTVTSNSDLSISIRLTRDEQRILPESITFRAPQEYITLQPGGKTTLYVTFDVSKFTAPGRYDTGIHGELKEPVLDRALMTQGIHIIVTASQA